MEIMTLWGRRPERRVKCSRSRSAFPGYGRATHRLPGDEQRCAPARPPGPGAGAKPPAPPAATEPRSSLEQPQGSPRPIGKGGDRALSGPEAARMLAPVPAALGDLPALGCIRKGIPARREGGLGGAGTSKSLIGTGCSRGSVVQAAPGPEASPAFIYSHAARRPAP